MGGQKVFVQMLDSIFKMPPIFDFKAYGKVIHEMREMQIMNFGQYTREEASIHKPRIVRLNERNEIVSYQGPDISE